MKSSVIPPQSNGANLAQFICTNHHSALLAYSIGLCKHYQHDTTLANDLLQQFYCKVIVSHKLVHDGMQKWGMPYLFKMIKLELFNTNRKAQSIQRITAEYCLRRNLTADDAHYHQAPEWELDELLEESLSAKEYAIISHYLQGYKLREIAELLSVNPNTVGVHIHRAKAKLRNTLK